MNYKECIDILIPMYNAEIFVERCLDSIFRQTYDNLRIVICDDGSNDNSAKIVKNYMNLHPNIELFAKKNESSISKTRNFLLTKIKSKYFTFIDIDDYIEPNYIEELYNCLISFDADISMCDKIRHKENKKIDYKKLCPPKKLTFLNRQEALAEMLSSNLYNGTVYAKLMKSSLLDGANFDENIHYGEDLDFCFKFMQNCNKFVLSNQKLYHYIVRKNSIVTSKFKLTKMTCIDCYENIINKVKDNEELFICAKSMQGLIAIELLYYTWRDKYKDKTLKNRLKQMIKDSVPYIRKNKRLSKLLQKAPSVWWLTKLM